MSARSVAEHALTVYFKDSANPAEMARKTLDAYAHELAEKIRNSEELRDATDDHMFDCFMAADLIDPEVSNGGG